MWASRWSGFGRMSRKFTTAGVRSTPYHAVTAGYSRRPSIPQPRWTTSLVLLAGLATTGVAMRGSTPADLVRFAAMGVGFSLALSLLFEFQHSRENVLRPDVVGLAALYFLLFFEFLFPQPRLNELVDNELEIRRGIEVCLWAFAGIALGRHLFPAAEFRRWRIMDCPVPPRTLLAMFWLCFALGYLHMLAAVDFDPLTMVNYFLEPRFDQPWARGRFGDGKALLYETGTVLYLVPSLAGVILGRRNHFSRSQLFLVWAGWLFTLFYGFSTGTRNVLGTYLITFLVSFFYSAGAKMSRETVIGALLSFGLLFAAVFYAIEFRGMGLKQYLRGVRPEMERSVYVDFDIYVVSRLVSRFPQEKEYIGMTGPGWLLVRPIPRVLWPGKPDGSTVAPEAMLDAPEGTTLSATFVGEAYSWGGTLAVIGVAISLGMAARWWTAKTYSLGSGFGSLVYGSGFFAVVISMRSIYLFPVALLPTAFLFFVGRLLIRRHPANAREQVQRTIPVRARRIKQIER